MQNKEICYGWLLFCKKISTCFLRKNPNFSSVILHIYDLLVLLHRTQKTRRYIMPESEAGGSPVFFMVDTEDRRLPIVQCLACHRTCVPLSCRWTQKVDGSPLSSVPFPSLSGFLSVPFRPHILMVLFIVAVVLDKREDDVYDFVLEVVSRYHLMLSRLNQPVIIPFQFLSCLYN